MINVVLVMELHNQIHLTNDSAAAIYTQLSGYCTSIQALSTDVRVIVYSCPPYTSDPTKSATVDALNVLLDADTSFSNGYVPLHLDARTADYTDSTYRAADGTHFKAAGNEVIRELTQPVLLDVAGLSGTITSVSILPATATLYGGQTQQFTPTIEGDGDFSDALVWDAELGQVNNEGLYTAPGGLASGSQSDTVTTTSVQDDTKSGSAEITIPIHQAGGSGNTVISIIGNVSGSRIF